MRRPVAACFALAALALSGCAVSNAASAEPTAQAPAVVAPAPRPSASPGFETRGPAQVVHTIDTQKKVVFLTIDDGLYQDPELLRYLKDENIPVTAFLTTGTAGDWQYWKDFGAVGSIQNHTIVHPKLTGLGETAEEQEICGANEAIGAKAGQAPWMLRPPYGAYDANTLAAAGRCGLDWVVHWSVTMPADKLEFQSVGASLKPGDIILTHFRKGLGDALPGVIADIKAQGFELARLEDYLPPRGWPVKSPSSVALPADVQMATNTESRAYPIGG